ncbi:hypothetical protein Bmayo_01115 [Borreliella mayonii]|uniref:Uncharacterized protein n=1 Tax=Borreliella mayonii TaxID=1674146 RepID=A0AAC9PJ19_9SPIR|nr:SIMPL domain-containing protein [Borreliella mayonii]APS98441.1 hypothetical protein A7X70_01115 [Borreliella mayonii]APS99566.1 hypothetical protein Bmayo_01115 [Borreliella mayonii]
MSGRKDLFFLILFLSLSIIIFCRIKNVDIKNGDYISVKGISEEEIFLAFLSWNLQYNGDSVDGRIKANNLNLSKIKTFLFNMYVCLFNC